MPLSKEQENSEIKTKLSTGHVFYMDLLRILASFLVVLNHTIGNYFFKIKLDSVEWFFSAFLFILCKTAVPLFFMITGSLLLEQKAQDYRKIFKYILRMVMVLIIWSYIYSCYFNRGFLSIEATKAMIMNIFTIKPVITPLWYLYALIGIYLMIPFLSKMTATFETKDFLIFLGFWGFFNGLIPEISVLLPQKIQFVRYFQYPLFTGWAGYLILGYYLSKKCQGFLYGKKIRNSLGLIACVVAFAVGVLSVIVKKDPQVVDNAAFLIYIILAAVSYYAFIRSEERVQAFLTGRKASYTLVIR